MRNPARILVVDDIADNVEILRTRLASLGYEVASPGMARRRSPRRARHCPT